MSHYGQMPEQCIAPSEIKAIVRGYIVTNFLFGDGASLNDSASLLEAGALDSTGVMEMVAFLEDRFGIVVKDVDLVPENLDSVDRIATFVAAATTAQMAGGTP
ncbi:MAG: acyl carrier protein [Rhodospirillaceae bacterium]